VSRLPAVLGPEVIIGGPASYRLGVPPAVLVDVDVAESLAREATTRLAAGEAAIAAGAASRALEVLGSGPLLVGQSDADWVRAARAGAERLVRDARLTAAAALLQMDDPAGAARALEDGLAADPLDEAVHRLLMTAHSNMGEPSKALAAFEQLRRALATDLGVDPAPETRAVHMAVLRERSPMITLPDLAVRVVAAPTRDPLPGREVEVARLGAAWSAAATGVPAVLLIVGEAGIGKTRLAREAIAAAEATGGLVLQARCYAAERSLFLQPFVDALAGLVATMRPDRLRELEGARVAAFAGLLPAAGQVFGAPPAERARDGAAGWRSDRRSRA
jgi:DNA-binding SARP family transcriptional activator